MRVESGSVREIVRLVSAWVTIGELGDMLAVQSWRIARLYELHILAEPPRVGRRRMIPRTQIPLIVDELRRRHWMPTGGEGTHAGS